MFDSGWVAVASEPRPSAGIPWSRWAPGPELAAALEGSEPVDLMVDEGFDAAERLAGWEAIVNWATGRLYRETAEYLRARQVTARTAGRAELVSESVAMEVAAFARLAPRTGEMRLFQAETLLDRLPRTLAALEAGRVSLSHARVVCEQVENCDESTARALDAELWSRPDRERTPTQLRDVVRRILTRLDPEQLRRRPGHARKKRGLRYWSDDHGATGVLQLRLPADEARGVYSVIDTLARRAGHPDGPDGVERTLEQARADTARDLILDGATVGVWLGNPSCDDHDDHDDTDDHDETDGGTSSGDAAGPGSTEDLTEDASTGDPAGDPAGDSTGGNEPAGDSVDAGGCADAGERADSADSEGRLGEGREGRDPVHGVRHGVRSPVRTEVRVTIGWEVLAGLSDRPGELEGHGPIPAAMARRLAGRPEAWWRRLLTDPVTGTAAHLDARRYRPPAAMRAFVTARDLTCAAPGCRVPATRCDLDHVTPYQHHRPGGGNGPTRADTLKPGCRRHHRIKTLGQWTAALQPDPDGGAAPVIVWTSPSGHRWAVRPPELDPPREERDTPDPDRYPDIDPPGRRAA